MTKPDFSKWYLAGSLGAYIMRAGERVPITSVNLERHLVTFKSSEPQIVETFDLEAFVKATTFTITIRLLDLPKHELYIWQRSWRGSTQISQN